MPKSQIENRTIWKLQISLQPKYGYWLGNITEYWVTNKLNSLADLDKNLVIRIYFMTGLWFSVEYCSVGENRKHSINYLLCFSKFSDFSSSGKQTNITVEFTRILWKSQNSAPSLFYQKALHGMFFHALPAQNIWWLNSVHLSSF